MYNKAPMALLFCLFLTVIAGGAAAAPPSLNMDTAMAAADRSEGIWNKYLPSAPHDKKSGASIEEKTASPEQSSQRTLAPQPPSASQGVPSAPATSKSSSAWTKAMGESELSNIGELTLYIKDTKKFLAELAPSFINYMDGTKDILLLRLLISPEVRELKLHKGKTSENFVAECLPANAATLHKLINEGGTLREFAELFGSNTTSLLTRLEPTLDAVRTKPTASSGVHQLGDLYFAAHDNTLLLSDNLTLLETLRNQRKEQADAFNIPSGNFFWAHVETVFQPEPSPQAQTIATSSWIGMNPTAWGWKYTYGSAMPSVLPHVFSQMPVMHLAATELYGAESPWFVSAWHGKFLAMLEMLQRMEQGKVMSALPTQGVESVTLSIGGVTGAIFGIPVPGITLALTGKNAVLDKVASEFKALAKTTWVNTSYPQWSSASVSQGSTFDLPVPLPLLIAQKDGALVLGSMSASSFSQGRQIPSFIEAAVKSERVHWGGGELAIPYDISSLCYIDVRALWRSCATMLEPDKPLRLLMDNTKSIDRSLGQMVDSLRVLTPPVLSMVNWTNAPNALEGEGYIVLHSGDTTSFSKTLAQIVTKMMADQ